MSRNARARAPSPPPPRNHSTPHPTSPHHIPTARQHAEAGTAAPDPTPPAARSTRPREPRPPTAQGRPEAGADKGGDDRQPRPQLGRVTLDQTAGRDELLVGAFGFAELQQRVD